LFVEGEKVGGGRKRTSATSPLFGIPTDLLRQEWDGGRRRKEGKKKKKKRKGRTSRYPLVDVMLVSLDHLHHQRGKGEGEEKRKEGEKRKEVAYHVFG